MMRPLSDLSTAEKLALIAEIAEDEESLAADYSALLEGFVSDADPQVRAAALKTLWDHVESRQVGMVLDRAANDPETEVRQAAMHTLGRAVYESELSMEPEVGLENASSEAWSAIHAPTRVAGEQAFNFLRSVYGDPNRPLEERRQALESMAFQHTDEVEQAIREAFASDNLDLQASAIFAMGRHGNDDWGPIVLQALHHPALQIQLEAARAAGELGLAKAANLLGRWARQADTDRQLRLWSIFALGQIGADRSLTLLERLASDKDEEIADTARAALDEWELTQQILALDEDDALP